MGKKIVISGAGISGLLSALLYVRQGRGSNVYLVDKCTEPGGLLRRFNYGEHGDFDYGMHNILETGISELDDLLFGLFSKDDWQLLEGNRRDLSGIYFNGVLQKNTSYIDLRNLTLEDYQACLADFLVHLDSSNEDDEDCRNTAASFVRVRFGKMVAEKVIIPVLEKIHKRPAHELDYMATVFTPLHRIAFCDEKLVAELTESHWLRDRIAWSDQRTLPLERSSGRRAYYPIKYGMYRVVDAIMARLREGGVNLLMGSQISGLTRNGHYLTGVQIVREGDVQEISNLERLIWTTNIPLLGRYLAVDFAEMKVDTPLRTVVVSMLIDKPLEGMGDLYYFFCYDPGFHTYRLTNFNNYCKGASRNGGIPISIELLMEEELAKTLDLEQIAIDELFRFGVTAPDTKVRFAKAELLDSGFPMPSVNNIRLLRHVREAIGTMALANLELVGILAKDNLFFQTDVLIDIFERLAPQILKLDKLAFYWRMTASPNFPQNPVPDFVDFAFSFRENCQLIVQEQNAETWGYLQRIYREDSNVGYLQEGHALAARYGNDFIAFVEDSIQRNNPHAKRISEIGAGACYLLNMLKQKGYETAAVDPSPVAQEKGIVYGIEIIPEFYPAVGRLPKSDVIIHYDVLEHVPDPVAFLFHHVAELNPGGLAVFAVPDCSPYIERGDISMILHEHLNYFDRESMRAVTEAAGLEVIEIRAGGYGGVLYCAARVPEKMLLRSALVGREKFVQFARQVHSLRTQVSAFLSEGLLPGRSVGCYVPLRAVPYLAHLNIRDEVRFFDDNPGMHGQYFDGFQSPVENMADLMINPVSHLLIMSFSFGDAIRDRINDQMPGHGIKTLCLSDFDCKMDA